LVCTAVVSLADFGGVVSFVVCAGDLCGDTNPAKAQAHRLITRIAFLISSPDSIIHTCKRAICATQKNQIALQLVKSPKLYKSKM
jgi:hypothetical protein